VEKNSDVGSPTARKKKNSDVESVKQRILPILRRHGVTRAGLFGSLVRGEVRNSSDIDVLVEIEDDMSLLDFVGIKIELEEATGRKVDLVEYDTIKPLLRERILDEQVVIL
jgi:predicted nucleotidyltransferase